MLPVFRARSTSSTSSTKSAVKKTIKHIFNATYSGEEFKLSLKALLTFLEFKESFKVEYNTKINKLFFSMHLELKDFKMYFEEWWNEGFMYTNRKEKNPLWSVPYYNKHFKENPELTEDLIGFLNELPTKENVFQRKKNSSSRIITLDLFDPDLTERDLLMISHLENLDIINLQGMRVQKSNSSLSTNEISSGEYHLLNSLIGIFASISQDSLILIDEPEISLHPNWQMRYITFLKKVFANYGSCHFVLSTHSHFLVSDLEGQSSSVTALNRDIETNKLSARLLEIDTYGWSAEDVLYNIFNVRSSLNYYLQADLTELLGMIANNIKDSKKIGEILNKLNALPKRENDPLQEIILEATEYLSSIQ
ncbi:MAG: AAA family ATPase [Saprospiraceae bacterium]|nr:AAA family ATPase [Saprospiraceae bacterium]